MLSDKKRDDARQRAVNILEESGFKLSAEEREAVEVVDYGLDRLSEIGLQIITYVNTDRYCGRDLVLFPNQVCPEHRHPPIDDYAGKQETLRCRKGKVYLYVEGEETPDPAIEPPTNEEYYTAGREIVLEPGEQYTIDPDTKHWFSAGEDGAIVTEFSSPAYDDLDEYTDPELEREDPDWTY